MRDKKLSDEDKAFIRNCYKKISTTEIAKKLGVPYHSVYQYVSYTLGYKKSHKFTPKEDEFIEKSYNHLNVKTISIMLNIPVSDIYNRARTLGIKKHSKK